MDVIPDPSEPRSVPRRSPPPAAPRRAARLALVIGLFAMLVVVAAGVGGFFLAREGLGGSAGKVVENAFLEVKIEGEIPDAPGAVGFALDPSGFPPILTEMTDDIRRAATDPTVKGLYLDIGSYSGGWGGAREFHDAILAFSASGKPCHAYADTYDNKTYFIASACTDVFLAPAGLFFVTGFAVTNEYYLGTLDKIGIHAAFEHVGDFKSAVEPLQRTGPSESASLAMDVMLDSLYGQFVATIASARTLDPEVVRSFVNSPPITPQAALAAGLVTGLKYRDEVREELAGKERTTLKAYHSSAGDSPFGGGKSIAVVYLEGAISSGESGSPVFGGNVIGDRSVAEIFEEIREDEDIVAVVLRVNSPGGSGLASDNIWREIQRTRTAGKPVVASMGDYAASGGYYIAAGTDRIFAQPGTLTGSIGVFGGKINLAGLYEKIGVSMHTWKRGELATMLSGTSDFSEAERLKFREFLETFYDVFLTRVAEGRKMEKAAVHEVAQGRVWTGEQAKERGLVDEIGGLDAAIASARTLAGIPDTDSVTIERLPHRKTFFDQIIEDLEEGNVAVNIEAPAPIQDTYATLYVLGRVLDDGVAAMLPGRLTIE